MIKRFEIKIKVMWFLPKRDLYYDTQYWTVQYLPVVCIYL